MALVAFVVNQTLLRDPRRFGEHCRKAAQARGWASWFGPADDAADSRALARRALTAGASLVFAAGGDGTVRACAQALACTGIPLAIVPLGTANLTARALGIPARVDRAIETGFRGRDRRIDLAEADGMPYAAMAGIGLDAAVVGATPRLLKERFGWLGYAAAGAAQLPGRRHEFTVRLDGGPPLTRLARSVAVGNAGLLPGGFTLLPAARLDDGLLDVGILAPAGPLGWGWVAYRIITGGGHDDGRLERFQARRVEIRAAADLPREVDGELIAAGRALIIEVRPAALLVRTP